MKVRRGMNATDKELRAELIYELTDGYWWHYEDTAEDFDPLLITYEVGPQNYVDELLLERYARSGEDWIPVSEDARMLCEISQEKYLRGWVLDIVKQYYAPGARIEEVIHANL